MIGRLTIVDRHELAANTSARQSMPSVPIPLSKGTAAAAAVGLGYLTPEANDVYGNGKYARQPLNRSSGSILKASLSKLKTSVTFAARNSLQQDVAEMTGIPVDKIEIKGLEICKEEKDVLKVTIVQGSDKSGGEHVVKIPFGGVDRRSKDEFKASLPILESRVIAEDEDEEKTYTWDQVQKHVDSGDMWLVVQDKVYDVSNFKHTGGIGLIKKFAGKDATKSFKGFKHSQKAHEILESMLIGRIDWDNKDPEITPIIEKPKAESLEAKLTVKSEPVPEMTPIIEKLKAENSNFLPEVKVEANQIKKVDSEEASSNPLPNSEQNPAPQKTSSKSESWRNPTFTVPVVQKNWKVGSESTSSDKRLY